MPRGFSGRSHSCADMSDKLVRRRKGHGSCLWSPRCAQAFFKFFFLLDLIDDLKRVQKKRKTFSQSIQRSLLQGLMFHNFLLIKNGIFFVGTGVMTVLLDIRNGFPECICSS